MADPIFAPISIGELFDKISILEIKEERIKDPAKLVNVRRELDGLRGIAAERSLSVRAEAIADLKAVNAELWNIEDAIRVCEARRGFGKRFIALARAVYKTNDRRSAIKREINNHFGSAIVEEKSYADG